MVGMNIEHVPRHHINNLSLSLFGLIVLPVMRMLMIDNLHNVLWIWYTFVVSRTCVRVFLYVFLLIFFFFACDFLNANQNWSFCRTINSCLPSTVTRKRRALCPNPWNRRTEEAAHNPISFFFFFIRFQRHPEFLLYVFWLAINLLPAAGYFTCNRDV